MWSFKTGFNGPWYTDLYVPLILTFPFIQSKMKYKKSIFVAAMALGLWGFMYSITHGTNTLYSLGLFVFVPYMGTSYLYKVFIFDTEYKKNYSIILYVVSTLLIFYSYLPIFHGNQMIFISYCSPILFVATISFFKLVYASNIKIPNIRFVSRSSYFFYFIHYFILDYFIRRPNFIDNHFIFGYIVGLIAALIISTFVFYIYTKLLDILQLNDKKVIVN